MEEVVELLDFIASGSSNRGRALLLFYGHSFCGDEDATAIN
jgi:hypothetical protein